MWGEACWMDPWLHLGLLSVIQHFTWNTGQPGGWLVGSRHRRSSQGLAGHQWCKYSGWAQQQARLAWGSIQFATLAKR